MAGVRDLIGGIGSQMESLTSRATDAGKALYERTMDAAKPAYDKAADGVRSALRRAPVVIEGSVAPNPAAGTAVKPFNPVEANRFGPAAAPTAASDAAAGALRQGVRAAAGKILPAAAALGGVQAGVQAAEQGSQDIDYRLVNQSPLMRATRTVSPGLADAVEPIGANAIGGLRRAANNIGFGQVGDRVFSGAGDALQTLVDTRGNAAAALGAGARGLMNPGSPITQTPGVTPNAFDQRGVFAPQAPTGQRAGVRGSGPDTSMQEYFRRSEQGADGRMPPAAAPGAAAPTEQAAGARQPDGFIRRSRGARDLEELFTEKPASTTFSGRAGARAHGFGGMLGGIVMAKGQAKTEATDRANRKMDIADAAAKSQLARVGLDMEKERAGRNQQRVKDLVLANDKPVEGEKKEDRDARIAQSTAKAADAINYSLGRRKDRATIGQLDDRQVNDLHDLLSVRDSVQNARGGFMQSLRDYMGNKRFDTKDLYSYKPVYRDGDVVHFENGNTIDLNEMAGGKFRLLSPNDPVNADALRFLGGVPDKATYLKSTGKAG